MKALTFVQAGSEIVHTTQLGECRFLAFKLGNFYAEAAPDVWSTGEYEEDIA